MVGKIFGPHKIPFAGGGILRTPGGLDLPVLSILTSLLVLVCLPQVTPAQNAPRILVQPSRVILGDHFSIRMTGLSPGEEVTLGAELVSGESLYRSSATFEVEEDGTVDLGVQAPVSGDYSGVDPLGIFWSMEQEGPASVDAASDVSVVRFELSRSGEVVARAELERVLRGPGVEVSEVRERGLFGTFFRPPGEGPHPGVILAGGSTGGIDWQRSTAQLLANHGYAALGLAYFRFEELRRSLVEIPLEYFGEAVAWMRENDLVDPTKLAFVGNSKGGELALLVGTTFPEITAVVGYVPASVVFQGIGRTQGATSSWTIEGEALPFVPYAPMEVRSDADMLELYIASLENQTAVESATIPVERIRGPVLLLSGKDDRVWPATAMSEAVAARLREFRHPYEVEHFAYDDAGHHISTPEYAGRGASTRYGGTAAGNARASVDAWSRVLAFLERHLKQ